MEGRCRNAYVSDFGWWWTQAEEDVSDPEASQGRGYFVDGTGIHVNLFPNETMSFEDVEAMAAPILDAMTFVVDDES